MEQFIKILDEYRKRRLLILCHDDADSDALGAAHVLARVLGADMAVPRIISEHARELELKLGMQVLLQPNPQNYDLTVLVDTADAQQLPGCMPEQYLLVDHHAHNTLVEGALAAVYELTDSTCQLVWRICRKLNAPLDENMVLALGAGIMGDTRHLATAANASIADLAAILEEGQTNFQNLLQVLRISNKIAREVRLQAAFSAQLHKVGNCLVASTSAERNYVYYIAMMLVEMGVDIAVVGYQQSDSCFIRLAKNPLTVDGFDLYTILEGAVQGYPRTNFWGNSEYAGFNGQGNVQEIAASIIASLHKSQGGLGSCQCKPTTSTQ